VLTAAGIRAILAVKARVSGSESEVTRTSHGGPRESLKMLRIENHEFVWRGRERNYFTSKANNMPEIQQNAAIARKARISTAINTLGMYAKHC
jgi:hypothetical protein